MKFATAVILAALYSTVCAAPVKRDVDASLVPDLGFTAGVNPTGTGDCDGAVNGANGQPIKVPCACPPDRATFLAAINRDIAAGKAVNNPSVKVSFPADPNDQSKEAKLARITAASISLQNLNGPGKGCPIVATTLQAQAKAIENDQPAPAPAAAPAPAPEAADANQVNAAPEAEAAPEAAVAAGGFDESLVPELGFESGVNPTGTGDCDGAVNGANGQPIKVPCACPPDRATFVAAMARDVAAGQAVNNPSVKVTFPTDNSKESQLARITAASISLQNLNGPGKGCPIVATTLQAQAKAIENGTAPPAPAAAAPAPAVNQANAAPAEEAEAPAAAAAAPASNGFDASLVPELGFQSGVNPTGTGDCDGAVNGPNGQPIKVPCACPPDRAAFIAAMERDVAAGQAVNNPSVKISFPTDNSKESRLARINAASVSLQNLNGPGKGCPIVATTLQAQAKAIEAGQ
ncbi:hypothetical protein HGRIS_008549 [Hohenbuehelia grisea]|uniref:Uncharacterized protein n=1 Tax=Hohenbuehelia grisea TaxID=104357 RepID=A0ABR3J8H6_9AGAR